MCLWFVSIHHPYIWDGPSTRGANILAPTGMIKCSAVAGGCDATANVTVASTAGEKRSTIIMYGEIS